MNPRDESIGTLSAHILSLVASWLLLHCSSAQQHTNLPASSSMTITQSALPCTKELMLRAADLVMEQHCCCTDWSPLDKSLHVLGHLFACRHQALRRSSECTGQALGVIAHCMMSCFVWAACLGYQQQSLKSSKQLPHNVCTRWCHMGAKCSLDHHAWRHMPSCAYVPACTCYVPAENDASSHSLGIPAQLGVAEPRRCYSCSCSQSCSMARPSTQPGCTNRLPCCGNTCMHSTQEGIQPSTGDPHIKLEKFQLDVSLVLPLYKQLVAAKGLMLPRSPACSYCLLC
jgi:hypothetical protein